MIPCVMLQFRVWGDPLCNTVCLLVLYVVFCASLFVHLSFFICILVDELCYMSIICDFIYKMQTGAYHQVVSWNPVHGEVYLIQHYVIVCQ